MSSKANLSKTNSTIWNVSVKRRKTILPWKGALWLTSAWLKRLALLVEEHEAKVRLTKIRADGAKQILDGVARILNWKRWDGSSQQLRNHHRLTAKSIYVVILFIFFVYMDLLVYARHELNQKVIWMLKHVSFLLEVCVIFSLDAEYESAQKGKCFVLHIEMIWDCVIVEDNNTVSFPKKYNTLFSF